MISQERELYTAYFENNGEREKGFEVSVDITYKTYSDVLGDTHKEETGDYNYSFYELTEPLVEFLRENGESNIEVDFTLVSKESKEDRKISVAFRLSEDSIEALDVEEY